MLGKLGGIWKKPSPPWLAAGEEEKHQYGCGIEKCFIIY